MLVYFVYNNKCVQYLYYTLNYILHAICAINRITSVMLQHHIHTYRISSPFPQTSFLMKLGTVLVLPSVFKSNKPILQIYVQWKTTTKGSFTNSLNLNASAKFDPGFERSLSCSTNHCSMYWRFLLRYWDRSNCRLSIWNNSAKALINVTTSRYARKIWEVIFCPRLQRELFFIT